MDRHKQRRKYILADYFMSVLAWSLFYFYRRYFIDTLVFSSVSSPLCDQKFYMEIVGIPFYWLFVYYLSGYYEGVSHKSRISELFQTLLAVIGGSLPLFFAVVLNDSMISYKHYYVVLFALILLQFICSYSFRLFITHKYHHLLYSGGDGFRTLIVGDVGAGVAEAAKIPPHLGNKFVGVVMRDKRIKGQVVNGYRCYGTYEDLDSVIQECEIEEVILSLKISDVSEIQKILNVLYRRNIHIKVIPDVYEKLIGSAKLIPVYGCNMMEISHEIMSPFTLRIKRLMDVVIASIVLVVLLPIFIWVMLRVVFDSKGAPLYKQERIGKNGKPFKMYKFRSMIVAAETSGPQLAQPDDDRITKYGRYMRKFRIDELPQFWNVLIGDMSIVGPRPERQFFIDEMVKSEPDYFFLQKIRPGITSLGMVKFGYADTVEKMLKRFKYDLIYVDNMTLLLDIKILYYTFFVIVTGKGV